MGIQDSGKHKSIHSTTQCDEAYHAYIYGIRVIHARKFYFHFLYIYIYIKNNWMSLAHIVITQSGRTDPPKSLFFPSRID